MTDAAERTDLEYLLSEATQGPWLVGEGGGRGATTYVYDAGEDGQQKSAIAGCTHDWVERPFSERAANARLIALAPAMARELLALAAPSVAGEDAERALFAFFCRKYVQRSDDRQRSMGLQYTEAETHDLAKETARFIADRLATLTKPGEPTDAMIEAGYEAFYQDDLTCPAHADVRERFARTYRAMQSASFKEPNREG